MVVEFERAKLDRLNQSLESVGERYQATLYRCARYVQVAAVSFISLGLEAVFYRDNPDLVGILIRLSTLSTILYFAGTTSSALESHHLQSRYLSTSREIDRFRNFARGRKRFVA